MRYLILIFTTFSFCLVKAQIPSDSLKGHYKFNGTLNDFSGQGNNIVAGSGSFVSDRFGNLNEAFYLNGISDSLSLPISEFSPITGDFTISFWYKTNHPEIMNCFSSKQTPDDTTNNFEIQLSSHNKYYLEYYKQTFYQTFIYWNGSGITTNFLTEGNPGDFTKGEWCHFVLTKEADTFRIYREHLLYAFGIDSDDAGTIGDAVDLIFSAAPYYFKGAIDDMRLYNRHLAQHEIDLLWFENRPFVFTQVKATDAYVHGSNVLVYWEYDATQISDSIFVEYSLNGGDWIPAVHTNMAWESYTYVNMSYTPGTTVEVRVSDFTNPALTASSGAFIQSEYDWVEVTDSLPFHPKDGSGLLNFQDKMWLLGGWDPPYHPPHYTHSEVWSSFDGENWNYENEAPWPARHIGSWLVSEDAMWVIGGDPQSGCLTDVWKSTDGINWTQTVSAIPGYVNRICPNYAYTAGQLFVYGGEQCSGSPLNDVWSSTDGITWNHIADAPWIGRGMQINSCVDNSGQIWMLSGSSDGTRRAYNEVWKSADGITWTLVNESAPWKGRYWHTVAWFDDKMWLMGGMATSLEMNDVWYSSDGITWHELKSTTGNWPAYSRHAQSTTVFDNALWYMCGMGTNNVWKIVNTTPVTGTETAQEFTAGLQVFPNPAQESIVVSFPSFSHTTNTIRVINSLGVLVYEKELPANGYVCSATIDISNIPAGTYILYVKEMPRQETKFVKQ